MRIAAILGVIEQQYLGHEMDAVFRRIPEALQAQVPRPVADFICNAAGDDADDAFRAKQALGVRGIYVGPLHKDIPDVLGVVLASSSAGLAELLRGTRWTAEAGKDAPWTQIARRLAQAHDGVAAPKRPWRFSGVTQRGPWVPIAVFLPEDDHE